jgi:hypothetical protein
VVPVGEAGVKVTTSIQSPAVKGLLRETAVPMIVNDLPLPSVEFVFETTDSPVSVTVKVPVLL